MLPFFRKIRYRLAKDNQFFNYSRYAIGEIVLVVVGILIALYLNNWNEERKEREKFDEVLLEVERELIMNIEEARDVLGFYRRKDSLTNIFLFDTITREDVIRDRRYTRLTDGLNQFQINNQAYMKLLEHSEGLRKKQDSIIALLKQVYSEQKISLIESNDKMMFSFIVEAVRYRERFTWYKDDQLGLDNNEMFDFFANNPIYESHVTTFVNFGMRNQRGTVESFEVSATDAYRIIHDYLVKSDGHDDELLFEYDPNEYAHYVGTFIPNWYSDGLDLEIDSVIVRNHKQKLLIDVYPVRFESDTQDEIVPINQFYFRTKSGNGFFSFMYDEEKITGLKFSGGLYMAKFKKNR